MTGCEWPSSVLFNLSITASTASWSVGCVRLSACTLLLFLTFPTYSMHPIWLLQWDSTVMVASHYTCLVPLVWIKRKMPTVELESASWGKDHRHPWCTLMRIDKLKKDRLTDSQQERMEEEKVRPTEEMECQTAVKHLHGMSRVDGSGVINWTMADDLITAHGTHSILVDWYGEWKELVGLCVYPIWSAWRTHCRVSGRRV